MQSSWIIVLKALLIATFISVFSLSAPFLLPLPKTLQPNMIGLITHTVMVVLSLLTSYLLTGGNLRAHGYSCGTFKWKATILLWACPMSLVSVAGFVSLFLNGNVPRLNLPQYIENIFLVWIYASICEEILTRGLLQSMLGPLRTKGFFLFKKWFLSLPIIISGLFFGLMHIVAIPMMGPAVVLFTTVAGLIAAYYREKTDSLVPAVIIHALFNIGGMLPFWLLTALFQILAHD